MFGYTTPPKKKRGEREGKGNPSGLAINTSTTETVFNKIAQNISRNSMANVATERIVLPWNPKKIAYKVRNVLSSEECRQLIEATESFGYERAMVNVGGGRQILNTDYRDSFRFMTDNKGLAEAIYNRAIFQNTEVLDGLKSLHNGRSAPVELNERLRFLKYHENQKFDMHADGCYRRPSSHQNHGDRSYFTILIYLNKEYRGSTRLFSGYGYNEDAQTYDVLPEDGMVFIHQHDILHAGMEISNGRKYCIRSDVMCRWVEDEQKKKQG